MRMFPEPQLKKRHWRRVLLDFFFCTMSMAYVTNCLHLRDFSSLMMYTLALLSWTCLCRYSLDDMDRSTWTGRARKLRSNKFEQSLSSVSDFGQLSIYRIAGSDQSFRFGFVYSWSSTRSSCSNGLHPGWASRQKAMCQAIHRQYDVYYYHGIGNVTGIHNIWCYRCTIGKDLVHLSP